MDFLLRDRPTKYKFEKWYVCLVTVLKSVITLSK